MFQSERLRGKFDDSRSSRFVYFFLLNSSKLFIRECLVCAPFYRRFLHRVQRDDREASTIPGSRSPSDSLLYSLLLRLASICFHSRVLLFPFCGSEKGRYKSSACKFVCVCVLLCMCAVRVPPHRGKEGPDRTKYSTQQRSHTGRNEGIWYENPLHSSTNK